MTYLGMPALVLFCLWVGIFLLNENSTFVGIMLIAFAVWFANLGAFGSMMCSPIVISGEGIAAHNFGRSLKFVRWQDVTKIKKVRRWNPASQSYDAAFYVFDGDFGTFHERMVNSLGPIGFTDKICGQRELLDKINGYAQRYQFPLIVVDQEAARRCAAERGAGAWERTVPKVNEDRVTAF
jgi:hypothetical protein